MSRMRVSRNWIWQGGAWVPQSEKRRVYDDMDVVQERDGSNAVTANYTRLGNIGGILSRSTSAGNVYFGYDGGGNVTELTDNTGSVVGTYAYDAFGNTVATSGAAASGNPYRFSTKEDVGGLYYYGLRFYAPGMGRWMNRDPLQEDGGLNLYAMVGNDPINYLDEDGLAPHNADVVLRDAKGQKLFQHAIVSGNTKAMFGDVGQVVSRQLNIWVHTERGFLLALAEKMHPGSAQATMREFGINATVNTKALLSNYGLDNVSVSKISRVKLIDFAGELEPCSACKGAMSSVSKQLALTIRYRWGATGWWAASKGLGFKSPVSLAVLRAGTGGIGSRARAWKILGALGSTVSMIGWLDTFAKPAGAADFSDQLYYPNGLPVRRRRR